MGTSFIPLCAIIAVLIIAFLFASLPQINHKTRYRVLYAIEKQQENVAILLEHQNEKQQVLQQRELEWLADKIKMFTEEEQKAILASACAFAEHGLIIPPSITIQQTNTCSQQDLMYFVCSAFFNMSKKRSDIVSFLSQVFPLYFPAGESVLAKKMPGWERVKERRERERKKKK